LDGVHIFRFLTKINRKK